MSHTDPAQTGFPALGLRPELLGTLDELGYVDPSPIQRAAIPPLLAGHDVLGQAATGTGKTAAFSLPIVERLADAERGTEPRSLVLAPTRELAVQVAEAFARYGAAIDLRVLAVFGGQPIHHQLRELRRGVDVVVATPGRAVDHIRRGSLDLGSITTVVLDEADEMLDMGFAEDIEAILDATPSERQTVLFSATMPHRVAAMARRYQNDPVTVRIDREDDRAAKGAIRQDAYLVDRAHKVAALGRILDIEDPGSTIVFCRTRSEVDELTVAMNARGYRAEALHGGMDQTQRDRVMVRLRDGVAELLVATDVAARGLDVDTLTHVVNYDLPTNTESYVHRIGRVGRAGREGVAITLVDPRQQRMLSTIGRVTASTITTRDIPSVADLRSRRADQLAATVLDAIVEDADADLDALLDRLTADHDLRTIALAALAVINDARSTDSDDEEIPAPRMRRDRPERRDRNDRPRRGNDRAEAGGHRQRPTANADTGFVYVGLGRRSGIRPGDLVGAIANETKLAGGSIGPIRISDHYSVVGVPDTYVDGVVDALRRSTVRGHSANTVRRYVD